MNITEEKKLVEWFRGYVRGFADKRGKLAPMLQLKLAHSRRVAANAAAICRDSGFKAGDVRAARILGLFHDIGRFNQFTRHRTFRDELSFNHGQHGAALMKKCPFLKACSQKDRRRILAGICHHNRANLPRRSDKDVLDFIKIGRDADKLDIFHVLYSSWKNGALQKNPDIILMVKIKGNINPRALEDIRNGRTVAMRHVKSLADFFLLQLAWVYDLNFRPSYKRLLAGKVIEQLAEVLPKSAEIREQISAARQYANAQIRFIRR